MKKDFTEEYENHLIQIINSVQPEGFMESVADFFGDIWLGIQNFFHGFNIEDYTDNTDEYYKSLMDMRNTTVDEIKRIFTNVRNIDSEEGSDLEKLKNDKAAPVYQYMKKLSTMIGDPDSYSVNDIKTGLSSFSKILSENLKFISAAYTGGTDKYGGSQGNAKKRFVNGEVDFQEEIREIVHRYYPDADDIEITDMLTEMASEGCNFMALVNTLIAQYQGNEDEFETIFGFPLYDKEGNVNFDLIMTDYWLHSGHYNGEEDGLTTRAAEKTWEDYLDSKKIHVDVVNVDVTVDNYDELSKQGEIITSYSPLRLRNAEGKLVDTRDGGHATVITGVVIINGKKMFRVSSWGEAYYIDPDDYNNMGRLDFQQTRY